MRRSRSKKSNSKKSRNGNNKSAFWGVVFIILAAVGFGLLITFNFMLRDKSKIDSNSLCPKSGYAMIFAALIDATDDLTLHQRNIISGKLREQILNLPEGALIVIGLVENNHDRNGKIIFRLCKPKSGENANSVHENPRLISERFNKKFYQPLEHALTSAVVAAGSNSSPIMESLQALVVQAFPYNQRHSTSELIIVSDLLQNSDAFSFYRGQDWDFFAKSQEFSRLSRNLAGVDVALYQLPRPGAIKLREEKIIEFWANYFDLQGASSVRREIMGDL